MFKFWLGRLSDIDKGESTQVLISALYYCRAVSYYPLIAKSTLCSSSARHGHMAPPSDSSIFELLFRCALEEYEKQTGIDLLKHPLAAQLDLCDSVESVTQVLQERAQAFREFRGGNNKVTTLLRNAVQVLYNLSSTAVLGEGVGPVCRVPVEEFEFSRP